MAWQVLLSAQWRCGRDWRIRRAHRGYLISLSLVHARVAVADGVRERCVNIMKEVMVAGRGMQREADPALPFVTARCHGPVVG